MTDISKVLNDVDKASKGLIQVENGDYIGENGLYYCGKCHTPKQCKVENPFFAGRYDIRHCMCKCMNEKREREEAERKRLEFENRVKDLRRMGFPEEKMQERTFANDKYPNEKPSVIARNYVDNFSKALKDGKGLLFFGTTGTGKTYAAACIANALIDKGYPVMMTNFARIENTVWGMSEGKQEYFDSLNEFPLLIIDDLAAERKTEYMQEIVFNVIDSRSRAGLPLIVTSNLTADEIKHPQDIGNKRIFSRLFEICVPIEIAGNDRRREKLKEAHDEYKDLLGY